MRNFSRNALILSLSPQGENNRLATVFTAEDGIFHATLYGGGKSKMRALVSPMNSGIIYLYNDEVRKSMKIIDFDVRKYHLSFRENLFKTWAASMASEILIKTRAGGSPDQSWKIANGFLDGMDLSDENESRLGLVRFLWRYLEILGVKPNSRDCVQCGSSFIGGKFTNDTLLYKYVFDEIESGFICPDCMQASAPAKFILGKPAITYLEAICTLQPKDVRKIIIDRQTFLEIKELSYYLIEKACDSKLKTLTTGIGIL